MLSTLLVVGVISHLWCAARLVGIAHHSFYSVVVLLILFDLLDEESVSGENSGRASP